MAEVHFYHLVSQSLEAVVPTLLSRARAQGWRSLVRVTEPERLAALDDHLWTFSDESFLPHGTDRDGDASTQPILLTLDGQNANGAEMLFLADGAEMPPDLDGYRRIALLLDGHDEAAVASARAVWRSLRDGGHAVTYWLQDETGRWAKRGGAGSPGTT